MIRWLRMLAIATVVLAMIALGIVAGLFLVANNGWVPVHIPPWLTSVFGDRPHEVWLPALIAGWLAAAMLLAAAVLWSMFYVWRRRQYETLIGRLERELARLRNLPFLEPAPLEDLPEAPGPARGARDGRARRRRGAGLTIALAVLAATGVAEARRAPAKAAPAASAAWIGTFEPADGPHKKCVDCAGAEVTARPGRVRVLTPSDGSPAASGDVVVVSPLLGATASGHVDGGAIRLDSFGDDARDSDDGVLVLPAGTPTTAVTASRADDAAIRAALLRDEALAGIKRALVKLSIGAIDIDGDGRADFAVTYGCSAWNDGACQAHGQFFLVRHGARWDEIQ